MVHVQLALPSGIFESLYNLSFRVSEFLHQGSQKNENLAQASGILSAHLMFEIPWASPELIGSLGVPEYDSFSTLINDLLIIGLKVSHISALH